MADVFLIQGNSLRIILPLKVFTLHEDGTSTESAFVPASGDTYKLALNGKRQYQYIPVLEEVNDEMCAVATLSGSEVYGPYGVEFVVGRADGTKLRYACECGITLRQYTGEVSGGDGAPLYVGGALLEAGAFIFAEGGSGEQSDWNETDADSLAYIKNKPTIPTVPTNVSAFNNDTGYLTQHQSIKTVNNTSLVGSGNINLVPTETFNNFCPIIEDTRSSAVAAITGVAPFSTLEDKQRIILHLKKNTVNDGTLNLTLSDNTTTGAKDIMYQRRNGASLAKLSSSYGQYLAGQYIEMVYNGTSGYWVTCAPVETNTMYSQMYSSDIRTGAGTDARVVSPATFHDNAYIVEETYSSGSLKANKMYDFGEVTSALTIPDLDVTNDLVSNAMNFWALHFKVGELTPAGTTELSITFPQNPSGIIVDDEPIIKEGDYVEIMITKHTVGNDTDYYASIKVWQAQ